MAPPAAATLAAEGKGNAVVGALGATTSGKQLKIRAYPRFASLEEERLYRKQHLAAAYRIFAERGRFRLSRICRPSSSMRLRPNEQSPGRARACFIFEHEPDRGASLRPPRVFVTGSVFCAAPMLAVQIQLSPCCLPHARRRIAIAHRSRSGKKKPFFPLAKTVMQQPTPSPRAVSVCFDTGRLAQRLLFARREFCMQSAAREHSQRTGFEVLS